MAPDREIMKKSVLYIMFTISSLTSLCGCGEGIKLSPAEPGPLAATAMEPIVRQSSIFVPIDISAKLLSETVEKFVPPRVSERRGISISGVKDEYVQIDVTRSPINTNLNVNGISVSGRTTRARARVAGKVRPWGPRFSQSANGTV